MNNSLLDRRIVSLFLLIFLSVALVLLAKTLSDRKIWQQRAVPSAGPLSVSLSPRGGEKQTDSEFAVEVVLTGSQPLSLNVAGVDISYDPQVLEVSQLACGTSFPSVAEATVADNKIYLSCFKPGGQIVVLEPNQSLTVGTFRVKVKTDAPLGTTELRFTRNLVPGPDEVNLVGGLSQFGAAYEIVSGSQPAGPVTVYFSTSASAPADSDSAEVKKGDSITGYVLLGSSQQKTATLGDIDLGYDSSVFSVSSVRCGSSFPSAIKAEADGQKIYLSCYVPNGQLVTLPAGGYVVLGAVSLRVKDEANLGPSQLRFLRAIVPDENDRNLTGAARPFTFTVGVGVTPTPTQPAGVPTLTFSVRSQGISQKRADQVVLLRVKKGPVVKEFPQVILTAKDQGVYATRDPVILAGITSGEGYSIFVKGPKHLAKKFCVADQTDGRRCRATEGLTLNPGANNFNFSGATMEGGDLPDPGRDNQQDGIVNSVDWSLLKSRLGSTITADLAVADIDLNGIVNAVDIGLLRLTLETKYEEDY